MKRLNYIWLDSDIQTLKDNYGNIPVKDLPKLIPNRSYSGIKHMIRKLGLHKRYNLRKYSVDKSCFSNYNSNSCYWAGFIAADGCVEDSGRISVSLKKSDTNHLEKLILFMNYTNTVKQHKNCCNVSISCSEIANDLLLNFNITPRKSKTLLPPYKLLDEDLISCFIKGVIDGDGSVMDKEIVVYGTEPLLKWIKTYFDKWTTGLTNRKPSEVRRIQNHLFAYKISGVRRDFIYNKFKNLDCDQLSRKWNKQLHEFLKNI